ncbi:MAG TPA: hypothetical protein VI522_07660 [Gammaproteobacteria bacterium]|nr:hypothetical protein [Gammaproteobacteria bacterium]
MDELRVLPKQLAEVIFLKVLLALVFIVTFILLAVASVAVFMYLDHYATHTIIIFSLMTWILFLLLICFILYLKIRNFNHTKQEVLSLVNKEAMTFIALHTVNHLLRKWRKTQ